MNSGMNLTYLKGVYQRVCLHHSQAQDLADNCPLLLWLLLDWMGRRPLNEVERVLRLKRRQILYHVSGANDEAGVTFLNKIQLIDGDVHELNVVHYALQSGLYREMFHWPVINIAVLDHLKKRPEDIKFALFRTLFNKPVDGYQAFQEGGNYSKFYVVFDAIRLGESLGIENARQAVQRCASERQIQRLHDRWMYQVNAKPVLIEKGQPFPAPFLEGDADIIPIRNAEDLLLEGRLMQHCVGAYVSDVLSGECFVYRVLRPERGTLEVKRGGTPSDFYVNQFKLSHNREPSQESKDRVARWLSEKISKMESGLFSNLVRGIREKMPEAHPEESGD